MLKITVIFHFHFRFRPGWCFSFRPEADNRQPESWKQKSWKENSWFGAGEKSPAPNRCEPFEHTWYSWEGSAEKRIKVSWVFLLFLVKTFKLFCYNLKKKDLVVKFKWVLLVIFVNVEKTNSSSFHNNKCLHCYLILFQIFHF